MDVKEVECINQAKPIYKIDKSTVTDAAPIGDLTLHRTNRNEVNPTNA